jgi:proteasome lid subunit RPN8/RPN11
MPIMDPVEANRKWLMRRAIQSAPQEACGFILNDGMVIEVRNIFHDPNRGFLMDPEKLKDVNPQDVSVLWHTHPKGSRHPSKGDVDAMRQIGNSFPHMRYIIVTKDDLIEFPLQCYAPWDLGAWEAFAR